MKKAPSKNKQLSVGRALRIVNGLGSTFMRPDKVTQALELICDKCGSTPRTLHPHSGEMLCLRCKMKAIK